MSLTQWSQSYIHIVVSLPDITVDYNGVVECFHTNSNYTFTLCPLCSSRVYQVLAQTFDVEAVCPADSWVWVRIGTQNQLRWK